MPRKISTSTPSLTLQDFGSLVGAITAATKAFVGYAGKAVNISLTLRNWLVGHYIAVYELNGADRAAYGQELLPRLAERLQKTGMKRVDARELRRFQHFYQTYPQIRESLNPLFERIGAFPQIAEIRDSLNPTLAAPASGDTPAVEALLLVERLSFTHFVHLLQIEDPLKRRFYEIEAIKGNWSVRELTRQVATQYFERTGLSGRKSVLASAVRKAAETQEPTHVIRDPYVFEFLGLERQDIVTERSLEDALLDKLQRFLLELGHGFCFEARQKRLVIGDEHAFVDLVFYHRILKCHVLVELKNDAFKHEHLGQLNAYVSYYKQHEMSSGDQAPIGILLGTQKNQEMVQYALAGMTNKLFVSRYQTQLPDSSEMQRFMLQALQDIT